MFNFEFLMLNESNTKSNLVTARNEVVKEADLWIASFLTTCHQVDIINKR